MQDQISEVIYYIKGTLKYKWIAISIAWLICLAGWYFVSSMPNKYDSYARVHVDSGSMLKPLLKGLTVQTDPRVFIRIMKKLMFTRENLEKIAELAGLEPNTKSEAGKIELTEELKEGISISGGHNDLFWISYQGPDANLAKAIVQAVLTVFSEQTRKQTKSDMDSSLSFLEKRIKEYETRLRNAEKVREQFKRANLDLLLDKESSQVGRMNALKTNLESAKLLLSEATSRRNVLNVQMQEVLKSDEDWGVVGMPKTLSPEDLKIQDLKSRKDELLLKYTEKYPEIIAINNSIEEIENRKALKARDNLNDTSIASAMVSPYVQDLKTSLNDADAQVASAKSRVFSLSKRLAKLEESLNARLTAESDMQAINRDYDSIHDTYLKLIASRERALMSEKASTQADTLTFNIAEPPSLPLEPTSPNRPLLVTIVLVAGIAVGYGVAFLCYFIRPSYMAIKHLRLGTGLPVLGGVSYLKFNPQIERNKTISYALAILILFIVYFILITNQMLQFS